MPEVTFARDGVLSRSGQPDWLVIMLDQASGQRKKTEGLGTQDGASEVGLRTHLGQSSGQVRGCSPRTASPSLGQ